MSARLFVFLGIAMPPGVGFNRFHCGPQINNSEITYRRLGVCLTRIGECRYILGDLK
ncbi:hypothetical protein SAMN05421753_10385 [Planctomicrobium piriforme]|uniref:Uncharacterized protein n=1 Tax=Planctomicrobium piriforme TaxID=1576369 RepID=A0A1I3D485_9PLAN|nr:hypothetical protein SAMN05421753_10385 [Planctomicrobium piriforme]